MDTVIETASRRRTLSAQPATPVLFAHFVLRSSNIQPMIDWYSAVLNMHIVQRTEYICFLTYDNEHHRLGIVNLAGLKAPDAKTWGLAHVAYTLADIGALLSTYRRVKALGIEPVVRFGDELAASRQPVPQRTASRIRLMTLAVVLGVFLVVALKMVQFF